MVYRVQMIIIKYDIGHVRDNYIVHCILPKHAFYIFGEVVLQVKIYKTNVKY